MSDITNVDLYNQAISEQKRILEIFEKELQVSDEADRHTILEQVEAHFDLMKHRAQGWTGLGTAQPLRKD